MSHAQAVQTSSSKRHNLAFTFFIAGRCRLFIAVTRHFAIRHALHGLHNVLCISDTVDELLVARFEQLQESPDRDVLKGRVAARDEAVEIAVDAAVGLTPVLDEDGVVTDWEVSVMLIYKRHLGEQTFRREITQSSRTVTLHLDTFRVRQWNEYIKDTNVQ